MAGYDRAEHVPVWRLRFEDFPGLWVRVTVPTVEAEALIPGLAPLFLSGRRADLVSAVAQLAGPFADSVLSWSVRWCGRAVKPSRRGVLRLDVGLVTQIVAEWTASPAWAHVRGHSEPAPELGPERVGEVDAGVLAALPMSPLDEVEGVGA